MTPKFATSGKSGSHDAIRFEALQLLARARGGSFLRIELAELATILAHHLLALANHQGTPAEERQATVLSRMMHDREGQVFTQALTDRVQRPHRANRVIRELCAVLQQCGAPAYLSAVDRGLLFIAARVGKLIPSVVAPQIAARIRAETATYVLAAEERALGRYLAERKKAGIRINLNRLGEEVLSEAEAERHVAGYVEILGWDQVDTISIKISSICSQINLVSYAETFKVLQSRLRTIYRAALTRPVERPHRDQVEKEIDSALQYKLVYLDMEAYRDLHITLDLFTSVLDEPEFLTLTAGVVLQAYIPDSAELQKDLVLWARARVQRGGAPIRLRVVKGANLAMERIDSALRGYALPTYECKLDADANYKRMVEYGTDRSSAEAVTLGIASHNLFDLAYGAVLRSVKGVERAVGFELLEGMANPLCRALNQVTGNILLYAPIVAEKDFISAVAYLARRLDENTAQENFLRSSFELQPGSPAFRLESERFMSAVHAIEQTSTRARRNQDRNQISPILEQSQVAGVTAGNTQSPAFSNEPDTDFSRPANRQWLTRQLERWKHCSPSLPLHIAGQQILHDTLEPGFDPSRPGHVPYHHTLATDAEIDRAISVASAGLQSWSATPIGERQRLLLSVARGLREARGDLIACMVLDAGKRAEEADTEVSEAVDFAEYYAKQLSEYSQVKAVHLSARGVTVVTPPWNFPLAIPVGGVLAALAAGNTVILKPAPETVLVAERAARVLWRAGVPQDALQFITAKDEIASRLITDQRVACVVLTGATATARLFHSLRPNLFLCAETGGKNAIIVSDCADHDLAIRDTLASAFGHAGQKCSAASLLILEQPLYESTEFLRKLQEAAASLAVGSAWDCQSYVTPLIKEPHPLLKRALCELDAGERWLLEPRVAPDNPQLWSPGIKLGVKPGSVSHTTEFFGPVLSVLCARDLTHALKLANATPYGLTAGFHSLNEAEQAFFLDRMDAGNLYVNRGITGAIVGRQPFGGRKASSFGLGAKAGGPNFVYQLTRAKNASPSQPILERPPDPKYQAKVTRLSQFLNAGPAADLASVSANYYQAFQEHFATARDDFQLPGQDNLLRYRPARVMLSISDTTSAFEFACSLLAIGLCKAEDWLFASERVPSDLHKMAKLMNLRAIKPSAALPEFMRDHGIERLRVLGEFDHAVGASSLGPEVHVVTGPVLFEGRFELLCYLREQSLSVNYHRYGNLGLRRRD